MSQPAATRWRLIELQRRRRAIDAGIDLLDRKREALIRAVARHRAAAADRRARVARALEGARLEVDRAAVLIGDTPALAAALVQPPTVTVAAVEDAIMGVHLFRLDATAALFQPAYGPGGTCEALDAAGRAFTALLPDLVALARDEQAERSLRRGLRRTSRTLNALRAVLRPAIEQDIRAVESSLEEEEREEAVRWRTGRTDPAAPP
jgi:V/A-type H+-transporting ATPase subunit D